MLPAQFASAHIAQRKITPRFGEPVALLTVEQVLTHAWLLRRIMTTAMREGEHFQSVPGAGEDKPALLEPGAQTLCLLFHLAPTYDVEERQLACGHREYRVATTLTSRTTGVLIGQGLGAATTLETDQRPCAEPARTAGGLVPLAHQQTRQQDGRHNAVLKAARKRALVDAVLTTIAASELFTQDSEEGSPVPPSPVAMPGSGTTQDFRFTPVHFGKNRGLTLAELTPQQIHWYEMEWMPRKEAEGPRGGGDHTLIAGLKAYRQWRDAEKRTAEAANPPQKRRSASGSARAVQPA